MVALLSSVLHFISWDADWSRIHGCFWYLLAILISVLIVLLLFYRHGTLSGIYLIDYSCVNYPDENKTNLETMFFFLMGRQDIKYKDIMFQSKVFLKSGVGEEAYLPRSALEGEHCGRMVDCYDQARILVVGAVDTLFKKTGVLPEEIDIVVVNSGMFNPSPSLTAMLVNHFKMRVDVRSFHLGGMGCSASLISVNLAKDLLRVRREARFALVASVEFMTGLYDGLDRSMMVTNCLFRCAGNALLLSNRRQDKQRAKLQLLHVVRVTTAAEDDAHDTVVVKEDDGGKWGVKLSPQIVKVASTALRKNIERLAPRVLPMGELYKAASNEVQRKLLKRKEVEEYVPNFKRAFDHFCIHPGGRAVIEGVGKALKLEGSDVEPSAMALHRFGNMSSSGIWYALAYFEAKGRLKKGNKVWQIGLGSGFKCTTAVWRVMKEVSDDQVDVGNPWTDCIHRYPVLQDIHSDPRVIDMFNYLQKKLDEMGVE